MGAADLVTTEMALQMLNTVGLGLVGSGLYGVYKSLIQRSELLAKSVNELEKAHDAVVKTMDKRSHEIDSRFDDEKKFRGLYLSMLEDAEVYRSKIKEWKEDEVHTLQGRLDLVAAKVEQLEHDNREIKKKYDELSSRLTEEVSRNQVLERQNKEFQVELGKSGPTIRGLA